MNKAEVLGKIIGTVMGVVVFVVVIIMLFGLIGMLVYGFGWSIGYIIHLVVGPDIIFGISFEQLIGTCWVLIALIYMAIRNASKTNNTLMLEQFKNITKKYRGY